MNCFYSFKVRFRVRDYECKDRGYEVIVHSHTHHHADEYGADIFCYCEQGTCE